MRPRNQNLKWLWFREIRELQAPLPLFISLSASVPTLGLVNCASKVRSQQFAFTPSGVGEQFRVSGFESRVCGFGVDVSGFGVTGWKLRICVVQVGISGFGGTGWKLPH